MSPLYSKEQNRLMYFELESNEKRKKSFISRHCYYCVVRALPALPALFWHVLVLACALFGMCSFRHVLLGMTSSQNVLFRNAFYLECAQNGG